MAMVRTCDGSERAVLVVLHALDDDAKVALDRGWGAAASVGWRLRVVLSVPVGCRLAEREAALEAWCSMSLPAALREDGREVREGELSAAAAESASRCVPALMVVPARPEAGRVAEHLVGMLRVPVLVARPARRGAVVGAVDLDHPELPVLRQIAAFTGPVHGSAVLVRSVEDDAAPALETRIGALRAATQWLLPDAQLIVTARPSRVNGILEVARRLDSDLIVVAEQRGAAEPNGELVARARRSVLIIPACWSQPATGTPSPSA